MLSVSLSGATCVLEACPVAALRPSDYVGSFPACFWYSTAMR